MTPTSFQHTCYPGVGRPGWQWDLMPVLPLQRWVWWVWPPANFSASSNLPLPAFDGKIPPPCVVSTRQILSAALDVCWASAYIDRPCTLSSGTEQMQNVVLSLLLFSFPLLLPPPHSHLLRFISLGPKVKALDLPIWDTAWQHLSHCAKPLTF